MSRKGTLHGSKLDDFVDFDFDFNFDFDFDFGFVELVDGHDLE